MNAVWEYLAATRRRHAEREAIVQGGERWTYATLARRADALTARLLALGVAPGDRVALLWENSPAYAQIYFAVMRLGAVLVALNPVNEESYVNKVLADCAPALLIAQEKFLRRFAAGLDRAVLPPRILLDAPLDVPLPGETGLLDAAEGEPLDLPGPAAGDLAMILYTSGTTGAPKGVCLTQRNLIANTDSINEYLGLDASERCLVLLPFYYSYGASVLHTHLSVGARVSLAPNLVFPHLVVESLARERATGFSGVPSTYALLLDRVDLAAHDLSSLRYLTQAGGPMAPALTTRVRAALPQARLYVMYGQTEATARLTWLPPEQLDRKLGAVGIPLEGVSLQVRREDGSLAATDEPGEVWVRGPNVMQGYWHNPQATAEVLRDGWLRTGDLGRLDGDGYLWLSGRRSDMIKTGAHRVHPQDVEEAIAELPAVAEVAVVGVDDAVLGQVVKACIVRAGELSADQVKAHCRRRLAPYKIPKHVEFLAALPKTASGKVRRVELIAPTPSQGAP